MFSPLFRSTTPTDGPARGATQGQRHALVLFLLVISSLVLEKGLPKWGRTGALSPLPHLVREGIGTDLPYLGMALLKRIALSLELFESRVLE